LTHTYDENEAMPSNPPNGLDFTEAKPAQDTIIEAGQISPGRK